MTIYPSRLNDERQDLLHAITESAKAALLRNQHKGTWRDTNPRILARKAREELDELEEAMDAKSHENTWSEFGDFVAAQAMMIDAIAEQEGWQ